MGIIKNGEDYPDIRCKYCGFIGKIYEYPAVYKCDDYETKRRQILSRCPKCDVLDSGERIKDENN
jgi:hypothetical protein